MTFVLPMKSMPTAILTINMYTFYTQLHENILDIFNENNVQIMTPAYEGDPDTPKVVPKDQWNTPLASDGKGSFCFTALKESSFNFLKTTSFPFEEFGGLTPFFDHSFNLQWTGKSQII